MGEIQYKTKQREIIAACLNATSDIYMTVDDMCAAIAQQGAHVGRTTVYRTLEAMVLQGRAVKATGINGQTHYRYANKEDRCHQGQLICLTCGEVSLLDCSVFDEMSHHISEHHDFMIDPTRSVLYGLCASCKK
ncbi:MAG: transcriptional repressor [Eggerthellaceae bacterium]|nr:transcriptional repressor [Eggerthellaceae bacterium]